jgi:uncharacterized protein
MLQTALAPANLAFTVAVLAFCIAFVLGALSAKTNFCTLGAVSDIVNMEDWGRMRMWALSIAIALIGTQALDFLGIIDLSKSFYPRANLTYASYIIGGAMFGVGMTLASGCGSRTLVRVGGGNLKSLVVLVFMGIAAYMTMKGLFGVWRVNTLDKLAFDVGQINATGQDIPALLAASGIAKKTAQIATSLLVAGALLVFVLKDREFRRSADGWIGGLAYGLAIIAGWAVSAYLGFAENPDTLADTFYGTNSRQAESLSFVAPVAYSIEILMLWSDKSLGFTFGIGAVAGMISGALVYTLVTGKFRWEGFGSVADVRNHMLGATLMGAGGVTAMGCTIGQGLSGVSTLALGSFIALAAMIAGCAATLKYQYWQMMRES